MQNQVTFYQLQQVDRNDFCLKLTAQLWRQNQSAESPIIWLFCRTPLVAKKLQTGLWEYEQDSFLANQIITESNFDEAIMAPICISTTLPLPSWSGFLINLSSQTMLDVTAHVIEIFEDNEAAKNQARLRYRHYQQQRFSIKHHRI